MCHRTRAGVLTHNVSGTLSASQEPVRCALSAPRPSQRLTCTTKGRQQPSSSTTVLTSLGRIQISPTRSLPFTQGHSPKARPPQKAVLTWLARALRMSTKYRAWLILRVQAWHLRGLHRRRGARTTEEPVFLAPDSTSGIRFGVWPSAPHTLALRSKPRRGVRPGWFLPSTSILSHWLQTHRVFPIT